MRIGIHVDPVLHAIPGGVGAYVRQLTDRLRALDSGDDLVGVRAGTPVLVRYAAWNFAGLPRVRGRFDVVHATNLVIPPAPGAALVATVHDLAVERLPEVVPQPWRTIYRRGLRVAAARAAVLCAVSEATRADLIEEYPVTPDRIVVTPLGPNVTPETARDAGIASRVELSGPFVLAVGTIEPRKNHLTLVRAFAEADLKDMTLVIAGAPGWGQAAVDEYLGRRPLRSRVVITGRVSDAEMAWLYSSATAFAMPSLYEGFGIPLLEAMSFGIPAVASTTPALAELAADAALLVDATDDASLAAALTDLTSDDSLRARLSSAARERARAFTWDRTAELTLDAYEKAATA